MKSGCLNLKSWVVVDLKSLLKSRLKVKVRGEEQEAWVLIRSREYHVQLHQNVTSRVVVIAKAKIPSKWVKSQVEKVEVIEAAIVSGKRKAKVSWAVSAALLVNLDLVPNLKIWWTIDIVGSKSMLVRKMRTLPFILEELGM